MEINDEKSLKKSLLILEELYPSNTPIYLEINWNHC